MKAYERFLNYAAVHTTSSETSGTHPSFAGEFDLGRKLEQEMKALGLQNVYLDEHCYLYGFLPASEGCEDAVPLAFIAHMDTSDAASGKDVKPVLHPDYDGGEVTLPGSGAVLSPEKYPALASFKGETLITSDGTTLLGADDKAGIAEILTAAETLIREKRPHGDIYICFTPDEEIGEGPDFFDLKRCPARFGYTVDGGDVDCLEYENFNAASAEVIFTGLSVHPGSAKNVMINAQQAAMDFHALLPVAERPESTEKYEGFYHLTKMEGCCAEAKLHYILRDHDRAKLEAKKAMMEQAAAFINARYGEGTVTLKLRDSYANMREIIEQYPEIIRAAENALRKLGLTPRPVAIRGGTDGATISRMGMPCPNLGTGGHNFHGNFEYISVERMDKAVEILLNITEEFLH